MSLCRFFKSLKKCLPTAEEAGLSARTTEEAVEEVLTSQHSALREKTRKERVQQVSLLKFGPV